MTCVFLGLTSLAYHGYIHFPANNFTLLFFMSEKSDYGCKSHLFILLLKDTRGGSITQLLWMVLQQTQMCLHLLQRGGIARSRGSSIFGFLRNFHTDSQSGWTSFYSHQQRVKFPLSASRAELAVTSVLTGVRGNVNGALDLHIPDG